jgi:transcriptional regulator with XRE-family HTH domain
MNQDAVATNGVSVPYISRIETGDIEYPSAEALMSIAKQLDTTALYLQTGEYGRCPYCGRS